MINTGINRGEFLRYTLLPGLLPRIMQLFTFSFANLAYLIALVFHTARILPDNHPYLQASNYGTYGIRQAIAAAANHLKPGWKNIDQIAIFAAILSAIVIFVLQFITMILAALSKAAEAAAMPTTHAEFFKTPNPQEDIAFRLLDLVFGIPEFFGSKERTDLPMHKALHGLFEFYSYGLLIVGCFIIIYFVITIVAETAESGTPFGKRFNAAWAPVRLVLFFALLIPITSGLNGGQLITLSAAKYGSGLATNGWMKFNEVISGKYIGEKSQLVGKPETPEMAYLLGYMLLVKTCQHAEQRNSDREIEAYIIAGQGAAGALPIGTSYQNAVEKTKGGDLVVRFGQQSTIHSRWGGNVYPHCGELTIRTSDMSEPGAAKMQEGYLALIREMWQGGYDLTTYGRNFNYKYSTVPIKDSTAQAPPPPSFKSKNVEALQKKITELIETAVKAQIDEGKWEPSEHVKKQGWGGAGIWYNKIAQQNGALISAVNNTPQPSMMPRVMEWVRKEKIQKDRQLTAQNQYEPTHANGQKVVFQDGRIDGPDSDIAHVLNLVYQYATSESFNNDWLSSHSRLSGNAIIDTINLLFGTKGLYDMCKDTKIHPLAQLSALGRTLIESSIKAVGFSVFGGVIGGLGKIIDQHVSTAGFAAASFFVTIAGIGLMLGFILFYVVPFLPFLYFFFGVGSWVKTIFEAMIGIPLWALAHLRIDGEGVPGKAASNGYFLILEIFTRPLILIFGLVAAIAIFSSMVKVLNEIFFLVVTNLSGHNPTATKSCFDSVTTPSNISGSSGASSGGTGTGTNTSTTIDIASYGRGPIDEFFFTIIYTIVVYMMGLSCFKLIDKIPDHATRWLNDSISSFGAKDVDPAEGLVQRIAISGGVIGGQLSSGLSKAAGALTSKS